MQGCADAGDFCVRRRAATARATSASGAWPPDSGTCWATSAAGAGAAREAAADKNHKMVDSCDAKMVAGIVYDWPVSLIKHLQEVKKEQLPNSKIGLFESTYGSVLALQ